MLEVVVGLFAQRVLVHQRQPGETLRDRVSERAGNMEQGARGDRGLAPTLTGQMFSLGVPRSCTIRSIWWISEVPGSSGLWASSSARMQPTALQDLGGQEKPLHRPPCGFAVPWGPPALPLPHVDAGGLGRHPQQQLGRSVPAQGTAAAQGDGGTKEAPTTLQGLARIPLSQCSPSKLATHQSVTTLGVMGFGGIP